MENIMRWSCALGLLGVCTGFTDNFLIQNFGVQSTFQCFAGNGPGNGPGPGPGPEVHGTHTQFVHGEAGLRVDASKLSRAEFRAYYEGKVPVVLTNVYSFDNDCFIEELFSRMKTELIEFDVRIKNNEVDSYEAYMQDFVGAMMESRHATSFYFMDEQILTRVAEDRMPELDLPRRMFGRNLFDLFPSLVRPKAALIMGGKGSRSFLHADPYEWVGTNYLFEGKKLWTFVPPDEECETPASARRGQAEPLRCARDPEKDGSLQTQRGYPTASEIFQYRRQSPDAWGGIFNLSAGWVSQVDLFQQGDADGEASLNQYLERTQMSGKWDGGGDKGEDGGKGCGEITAVGDGVARGEGAGIPGEAENEAGKEEEKSAIVGSALLRARHRGTVPLFQSGIERVDRCDARALKGSVQVLQEEGDLIIIPPRWWHQVYNLQPTVAVASQYMNEACMDRVLDHMLGWNNMTRQSPEVLSKGLTALGSRSKVLATIEACLVKRHGAQKGMRAFRRLATARAGPADSRASSRNAKVIARARTITAEARVEAEAEAESMMTMTANNGTLGVGSGIGKTSKGKGKGDEKSLKSKSLRKHLLDGKK